MNPVPLTWMLIIFGVLTAGIAGVGKYAMHLHGQLAAQQAQCAGDRVKDAADTTAATRDAETQALRDQVTRLEELRAKEQESARQAAARASAQSALADKYRRQLDEARKADPGLDDRLDAGTLERLRRYEADYQGGGGTGGEGGVPPGAGPSPAPAVQ